MNEDYYLKSPEEWTDYIQAYERDGVPCLDPNQLKRGELYRHVRHGMVVFLNHIDDYYADVIAPDGRPRIVSNRRMCSPELTPSHIWT